MPYNFVKKARRTSKNSRHPRRVPVPEFTFDSDQGQTKRISSTLLLIMNVSGLKRIQSCFVNVVFAYIVI